jgi:hypothetical protein
VTLRAAAAEREAVESVQALLSDLRDEEAQQVREPAHERLAAHDAAGEGHAEKRQPEEFERAERQCHFGQQRREEREAENTDERAHEGARRRDPDGAAGLALRIVSVVSSAIASVADSPGRMPMTIPTNAPPSP